ncbi:unnamed protein product, partial [Ostreobium quekettii]
MSIRASGAPRAVSYAGRAGGREGAVRRERSAPRRGGRGRKGVSVEDIARLAPLPQGQSRGSSLERVFTTPLDSSPSDAGQLDGVGGCEVGAPGTINAVTEADAFIVAAALVACGAEVTCAGVAGWTALHWAAHDDAPRVAK